MPKTPNYSPGRLERAIEEIRNGESSVRSIAKKYNIPRATLHFKICNSGHKSTFGPSPILTEQEESTLVRWISDLARKGFPRKKEDLALSVQQFLNNNPRPHPFRDNKPGEGWMRAFLKRNPSIVFRSSEGVTTASACVTEKDIRGWFEAIETYVKEKNLEDVMMDPTRIFNGDETCFQICPQTGKVLAPQGCRNVYNIEHGSSKENITVMFTFSAEGKTCSPMVIFPYKRVPEKIAMSVPPTWGIGRSDNGWMTAQTFYEYVANVFYPYLVKEGVNLPAILFMDGHKSHLTFELSTLCSRLGIELIALYPNTTRILQPADVAVFRPIKVGWRKAVKQFHDKNPGVAVTKLTFAPILHEVVEAIVKPTMLQNGFRVCGLYPFDANAVDYTKCLSGTTDSTKTCYSNNNNDNTRNAKTIDISTFMSIVGKDKVELFTKMNEIESESDQNFLALYEIWKHLKTDPINTPIEEDCINDALEGSERMDDTQSTDEVLNSYPIQNERELLNFTPTIALAPLVSTASETQSSETLNLEEKRNTPDTASINNYLMWPNSPKRKGKRQVKRYPFAITSENYQNMLLEKQEEKLNIEKKKERKKKQREEKLAAKENNKKTIQQTRKRKPKNETQLKSTCFICGYSKTNICCDTCHKSYHIKCIPKKHQEHVPNLNDGDLFLCHMCYNEESSDTNDSAQTVDDDALVHGSGREKKDEIKQSTIYGEKLRPAEEEDEEIEELYKFYLEHKDM